MRFACVTASLIISTASLFAAVDYARDVQPILAKHCYDCHGAQKQKNALRLDVKAHAFKGGEDHGVPILPGKSADSVLIKFVSGEDEDNMMPPKGARLTSAEVSTLRAWIDEGAVWPDDGVVLNDPLKTHWAYQPVKRPASPEIRMTNDEIRNPIDAFIAQKLIEKSLAMSPPADARTLCRRLYFDVIGLPPSPEELDAFISACSNGSSFVIRHSSFEQLVLKLLASPRYGERWARHWLDVVRFAESDGFEKNTPRPNAWPYRDYVIKSLNDDKPYDQFVREQLAGDALGADEATGFLVAGSVDTVRSPDPVLTAQQRADELNEMVSATGSAFLGLTVNCARCHNHKFDPISHTDYTAMCATFAGVQYGERALKPADYTQRIAKAGALKHSLAPLEKKIAQFEPMAHAGRSVWIFPTDKEHAEQLITSSGPAQYPAGSARGLANDPGDAARLPTLGAGYLYWFGKADKDVLAWKPEVTGRHRIWLSWGAHSNHSTIARYFLDTDGDAATRGDQKEIAKASHRSFADGSDVKRNERQWSGFLDAGVHELTPASRVFLRGISASSYVSADVVLFQEVTDDARKPTQPFVRVPVARGQNTERFTPVEAKFVRFTIEETTQLQPCLDELEVFTCDDKPRNIALGTTATASSTLPGHAIHQLKHVNDGLYGNEHSWISNEKGKGWVCLEFAQPQRIDRVVWSRDRDNVPRYNDRLPTQYHIEVSRDGTTWQAVATHHDRLPSGTKTTVTSISRADGLPAKEAKQFATLQAQRTKLVEAINEATATPMAYTGKFAAPTEVHRYQRGDVTQPKEIVQPAVLASLGPKAPLNEGATEPQRRLALADWIVDRQNPLTARVIVNRLWHHHFGTGLVDTPSDFGVNGGRPTHPELLDWLACELMDNGWSLKHIHRLILTSETYQQSSSFVVRDSARSEIESNALKRAQQTDADNRLLWRFPPRRLEAEALRDTMLAVSGKLDLKMGGPGFDLFEPNTNYVKVYTTKTDYGPAEFRRMVYQSKPRVELDSIFGTFDCPDAGQATAKRTVSTTPLQALSLLNSNFAIQQSGFLAERVQSEAGDDAAKQCAQAFLLAFGRKPTPTEAESALVLMRDFGLPALCRALYNANEFIQIR